MNGETAQISHYRLISKIGSGGMGVVWLAHDEQLRRDVAIKLPLAEALADDRARARLMREARAASGLNHPNVCTIYEAGEAEGRPYIVMELVDGQPLDRLVPANGLPASTACRYGAEIADALDHAHGRGVVHRDLKLSNIMVTAEGRVKVLDFGLSRYGAERRSVPCDVESTMTAPGAIVGTPLYLAPEVWRGERANERSDLWALGVVLYQLLAGSPPFSGATAYELSAAILNQDPVPLPETVPAPLRQIVFRLLEKDPRHRLRSAAEVRAALEVLQAGVPDRREARRALPRLGWRGGLAVAVVAVAAGAVWLLVSRQEAPPPTERQITFNPDENSVMAAAISPDGNSMAWCDLGGICVQDLLTGEMRQLPRPPDWEVDFPFSPYLKWSPDGTRLLVDKWNGNKREVWGIAVAGGLPTQVYEDASALAFSPDGSSAAFLRDSTLWAAGPGEDPPRQLYSFQKGLIFPSLAWSPGGEAIAVLEEMTRLGIRGCVIKVVNASSGRITAVFEDSLFSLNYLYSGCGSLLWLRNGYMVYPRDKSPEGKQTDLWAVRVDIGSLKARGAPRQITNRSGELLGYLSATADGSKLAFLSYRTQADVYVAETQDGGKRLGAPRRLTLDERFDDFGIWTPDGKGIAFSSDRNGSYDVFVQNLDGQIPRLIAGGPGDQRTICMSPDGEKFFFSSAPVVGGEAKWDSSRIFESTLSGALPREIVGLGSKVGLGCGRDPASKPILAEMEDSTVIFYAFEGSHKGPEIARVGGVPPPRGVIINYAWDISPDGRQVIFCTGLGFGLGTKARLRLIDLITGGLREIEVPRWSDGWMGFSWGSGGRDLIAEVWEPEGETIFLRLDLKGKITEIHRTTDIVWDPRESPDGRYIAFTRVTHGSNAWVLENPAWP